MIHAAVLVLNAYGNKQQQKTIYIITLDLLQCT